MLYTLTFLNEALEGTFVVVVFGELVEATSFNGVVLPLAFVTLTVRFGPAALSILKIIPPLSLVRLAVIPLELTLPVALIILKRSTVNPLVISFKTKVFHIVYELALKDGGLA